MELFLRYAFAAFFAAGFTIGARILIDKLGKLWV